MVKITNGAGIRRIIEDRHNILKEQSAKLDFNTEGWKKAVGYNNSLSVLEIEIDKIGDKDLVLLAESLDDYEGVESTYGSRSSFADDDSSSYGDSSFAEAGGYSGIKPAYAKGLGKKAGSAGGSAVSSLSSTYKLKAKPVPKKPEKRAVPDKPYISL